MQLNWVYKSFNELTVEELYAILQLRNEVFSVEQNCVYQDADDKDQPALHFCGWDENKLAAYCRILPKGISYAHPGIGRVVTSLQYRKGGYGRELMQLAVKKTIQTWCKYRPILQLGRRGMTSRYASKTRCEGSD